MASAHKAATVFRGTEEEDIHVWLQTTMTITKVYGLNQQQALRLIYSNLQDAAQEWASQTLNNDPTITIPEFVDRLKKRFSNERKIQETFDKFLSCKRVETRKEYLELLSIGTYVLDKGCINQKSLYKQVIDKMPEMMKTFLYQIANSTDDWTDFKKSAEEVMWISFPVEKTEINVSRVDNRQKMNRRTDTYQRNERRQENDKKNSAYCMRDATT